MNEAKQDTPRTWEQMVEAMNADPTMIILGESTFNLRHPRENNRQNAQRRYECSCGNNIYCGCECHIDSFGLGAMNPLDSTQEQRERMARIGQRIYGR